MFFFGIIFYFVFNEIVVYLRIMNYKLKCVSTFESLDLTMASLLK